MIDVENEGLASGGAPNNSDAYTINGKPGDLYNCSKNGTYIYIWCTGFLWLVIYLLWSARIGINWDVLAKISRVFFLSLSIFDKNWHISNFSKIKNILEN